MPFDFATFLSHRRSNSHSVLHLRSATKQERHSIAESSSDCKNCARRSTGSVERFTSHQTQTNLPSAHTHRDQALEVPRYSEGARNRDRGRVLYRPAVQAERQRLSSPGAPDPEERVAHFINFNQTIFEELRERIIRSSMFDLPKCFREVSASMKW